MNILDKYFITARVDYNSTPGGKELYKTYCSMDMPSWSIIDLDESVIADSESIGTGYVGYPEDKEEIAYYLKAIKRAAPVITDQECEILKCKLKLYD
jgi:pyridoxal/pyridoxine/pyridoxamine kinase